MFAPRALPGGDKLKTNLVRHSEAQDFMCDDCGEQCKRKDKLGEHEKRMHKERPVVGPTKTKPLECDICGKRSLKKSGLAGQVKMKQNTIYDCPICLQEFGQESSLKEHGCGHKEGGNCTLGCFLVGPWLNF